MTDYQQTVDWLFSQLPMFEAKGNSAYKPGLDTVTRLSEAMGNPHRRLRCIHIAGTNGKGSTAHTLAAILQSAGYSTGLFTSPHLIDFRERMRVDGNMISREEVVDFVERYQRLGLDIHPTFFELTTVMAFEFFARRDVDYAVIETGLGGRLDSTNIITPILSVITNISLDHTSLLGSTKAAIAAEKAGIIKPGVPVVVGEAPAGSPEREVFEQKALDCGSRLTVASDKPLYASVEHTDGAIVYTNTPWGTLTGELCGDCQPHNTATVLAAVARLTDQCIDIPARAVARGMARVSSLTSLMGRWQKFGDRPTRICDTGHNPGGWSYIARSLEHVEGHLHAVLGFVGDKDVAAILAMLPRGDRYSYYLTMPRSERALDCRRLQQMAAESGISAPAYDTVAEAYENALLRAKEGDTVFVGGSTYVVSDLMKSLEQNRS